MTDLVIARYDESLLWTKEYSCRKIIYNKGDLLTWEGDNAPTISILPNVGREAHTFLFHIVTNWDNLADWTVFSQGWYRDHMTRIEFESMFIPREGAVGGIPCWVTRGVHAQKGLGVWAKENLGVDVLPSKDYLVWIGAFFGASRNTIRKVSLNTWRKLLLSIPNTVMPDEAFFMEWAWSQLLGNP
jgi:hypothetical protein